MEQIPKEQVLEKQVIVGETQISMPGYKDQPESSSWRSLNWISKTFVGYEKLRLLSINLNLMLLLGKVCECWLITKPANWASLVFYESSFDWLQMKAQP